MSSKTLLAMPMFNNNDSYQMNRVLDDMRERWAFDTSTADGDDVVAVMEIAGQTVALAFLDVPIPWGDIGGTAKYAYNWVRATNDLADHTGHAIVSIMPGNGTPRERFMLLSKVLYSVLETSKAIGVYIGDQSLLIPRFLYLDTMDKLEQGEIPLSLWIYIGLKEYRIANCAYTYGLTAFGKKEIEIINSELDLEDLYEILFNTSYYVINNDVTLKEGQTIGRDEIHKIKITVSEGAFVGGESIKLLT